MIRKNLILVLIMAIIIGLLAAGCGGAKEPKAADTKAADTKAEKKLNIPKGVTVSTSAVGGTYHIWATGWGQIINKKTGLDVAIETGGGPVTNVGLVQEKRVDIGLVTMGPAYEGYTGTGWANGKKHDDIRALFPMFVSYLHWWVMPNSDIKSIYDLTDKVVCNGPAGSSPHLFGKRVFDEFGIKPKRIISGHYSDVNQQMRDGLVDAVAAFSGLPNPACDEMVQTVKARIIAVGKEESEKVAKKYGITTGVMKKGIYATMQEDLHTLTMWNTMIMHKDAPEDLAYLIVKTTFENLDEVRKVHSSAKDVQLENVKYIASSLPLHPGAIKYYKEKGLQLPDSAYPPEYKK